MQLSRIYQHSPLWYQVPTHWSTLQNYMQIADICLANTKVSVHSKRDLVCRYAQQEPELPGTSTVWEFLRFHARLRMPAEQKSNNGAEARVWSVISQLGLNKVQTETVHSCAKLCVAYTMLCCAKLCCSVLCYAALPHGMLCFKVCTHQVMQPTIFSHAIDAMAVAFTHALCC